MWRNFDPAELGRAPEHNYREKILKDDLRGSRIKFVKHRFHFVVSRFMIRKPVFQSLRIWSPGLLQTVTVTVKQIFLRLRLQSDIGFTVTANRHRNRKFLRLPGLVNKSLLGPKI